MLTELEETNAEEWVIHDHEVFGGYELSEFESIEEVVRIADYLASIVADGVLSPEHRFVDLPDGGCVVLGTLCLSKLASEEGKSNRWEKRNQSANQLVLCRPSDLVDLVSGCPPFHQLPDSLDQVKALRVFDNRLIFFVVEIVDKDGTRKPASFPPAFS